MLSFERLRDDFLRSRRSTLSRDLDTQKLTSIDCLFSSSSVRFGERQGYSFSVVATFFDTSLVDDLLDKRKSTSFVRAVPPFSSPAAAGPVDYQSSLPTLASPEEAVLFFSDVLDSCDPTQRPVLAVSSDISSLHRG